MTAWITWWMRALETSIGASEVVARRTHYFSEAWTPAHAIEAQRMVTEKMIAASQFWWIWTGALIGGASAPAMLGHLNRALHPMQRTVRGNVHRLRKR